VSGLRLDATADRGDLTSFLGRAVALDPAAVARLRAAGERVTAYVRLPFGVLVSRTVAGSAEPADVTVGVAGLLAMLDGPAEGRVRWPARRDVEWRAALPPAGSWRLLDSVPGDVVRALVRAGRDALRAVPAGAEAAAGESLLDHESLTVSGGGQTAVLPLRVISALTRMGFLGGDPAADVIVVSAAGGWIRLAGAYGSAYQHTVPALGLTPR
jgi:hypothetical protein